MNTTETAAAPATCRMCGEPIRHNGEFWEHIKGMPRHPAIPMQRSDKARFARLKLDTLQAAVTAEDWREAQNAAEQIAQAALWLELSDAEIERNA